VLTILRLIQYHISKSKGEDPSSLVGWTEGMSAERIVNALNTVNASYIKEGQYMIQEWNEDIEELAKLMDLKVDYRMKTKRDIKEMKKSFRFQYT